MTRRYQIVAAAVGLLAAGVLSLWLSFHVGFCAQAPQGFAPYRSWWTFKAVSPDGVIYRVRSEPNKPAAELPFWREALKKRMLDAGYAFMAESDLTAGADKGYLLELAAPQGSMDYAYLIGLFVDGGDIVIAEAAGEVTKLQPRRADIVEAMRNIEL